VLGFPLAGLLMFYTIIRSTVVVMIDGGIVWRGTFYPLKDLRNKQVIGP
jgi:cytochrome b subunit of formate dehydrogenase